VAGYRFYFHCHNCLLPLEHYINDDFLLYVSLLLLLYLCVETGDILTFACESLLNITTNKLFFVITFVLAYNYIVCCSLAACTKVALNTVKLFFCNNFFLL